MELPEGEARVSRVVVDAARTLAEAGVDSPRTDAELLAAHVLGVPRSRLALVDSFRPTQLASYRRMVVARARRVPLQHLTGTAPFRRLDLAVGPGVFVPRPETELLVEWGLSKRPKVMVDLCAGSGAIALSVAQESPQTRVYAVESAPGALIWLRRNVELRRRLGDPAVTVVPGDVADPAVLSTLDGQVDLVLCNPPYVPDGTEVPPEVAVHDPDLAVFGGPDGLAVIRSVVPRAATLLRPGGWFGVEHDDSHGGAVPALLGADGRFDRIADHRDLTGRPRFCVARVAD